MNTQDPITRLSGVGSSVAGLLLKLRISTVGDLLNHVPYRFDDYSKITSVRDILPGPVTIQITFSRVSARYSKKGLHMTEATASDSSGSVKVVWFNQPYRERSIKLGESYYVSGDFGSNYKFFAITNPACELVSSFPVNTARLVPVYKLTKGLGVAKVRSLAKQALELCTIPDTLPTWLVAEEDLLSKAEALSQMHFPINDEMLVAARRRLGFEEIFELTLASELNKQEYRANHSRSIPFEEKLVRDFVSILPYDLTGDQRKVVWQIYQDMAEGTPMNRLVEGDVGSGKTVVSAMAALGVLNAGMQVALMAPTELLARQHAESFVELFEHTDYKDSIVLLTGSMKTAQKQVASTSIESGQGRLIIGTHALFQDSISFQDLGLVIVDEQHRFGVEQRKKLQAKAAPNMPHVLHMTATPIPRSLALTLYGELDVSLLKEMPPGRIPIETSVHISENREKVYREVADAAAKGQQVFVVCPQIEEGEDGRLSAVSIHSSLAKKWLKDLRLGLLHGKMSAADKEDVMSQFVSGKIDVLIATTVIEVGVNVPNATFMIIEGAERFGLAQLHQLRGRVGRGVNSGHCRLLLSSNDAISKRMKIMEQEHSGFVLADYDLRERGPGAIYGHAQHGELDLRVARLDDIDLIKSAKNAAREFTRKGENLLQYPQLNARVTHLRSVTNLN